MSKGMIFNIQKFCIHDGPGIRTTVFFKGCPLKCMWCHNPESQEFHKELMIDKEKCTNCGKCIKGCSSGVISINQNHVENDLDKCVYCENCIDLCVNNVRQIIGKEYTINELMKEIKKDTIFYENSGGGVTFSGGEAISQIDFVEDLAEGCKYENIPVALDTSGYAPFSYFERIKDYVDLFLYDIKLIDEDLHKKYTGVSNKLILENLKRLSDIGANINLRIPLIEGINTSDDFVISVLNVIRKCNILSINLLPYHDTGKDKYARLNRSYNNESMKKPSDERMCEIENMFRSNGYKVKIGG